MAEIPDVLLGVLREDDYLESLKAIRDRLAQEMSGGFCNHCERQGPRDSKDLAAITLRIVDVLTKIEAYQEGAAAPQAGAQGAGVLTLLQGRVADAQGRRTGPGTQTTSSPQSVAKRQDHYGRRPGAGRKPGG